jgi:cyclophilin family peptidyl-prolyl cis-trans isomerase
VRKLCVTLLLVIFFHPVVIAKTIIEIDTSLGIMQLELYTEKAPKTVANFLRYIEIDYYNGLVFHRVIDDWIIQSGGYDENFMVNDTMPPIRNEATNGFKNIRGTIAMARMSDPHSAESQFFINLANNTNLNHRARTLTDYGYTVFGKVILGLDVADAIGDVETHEVDGYEDVPVEPVFIKTVKILSRDE